MQIPIKNIYYLLSYAWNKLEESDRVRISIEEKTHILDLFAKVLINATRILLKRGIDQSYVELTSEIHAIRGKLEFSASVKRGLLEKSKAVCSFDEFSSNILANKILVTTLLRLVRTKELDKGLKEELISLMRMLPAIDQLELRSSMFKQVKLSRNNRFYGFILNVCQIMYECTLPTEKKGEYYFVDFTRDQNKMNRLFEEFVRNFYKIECDNFPNVRRENIRWNFDDDSVDLAYLPQMMTDITLENEHRKIIIDAKYYSDTLVVNFEKEKIRSSNLYQLFSYIVNQEDDTPKTMNACGILLYPTVQKDYDLEYSYGNHKIKLCTVNLNTDWTIISKRLLKIVDI